MNAPAKPPAKPPASPASDFTRLRRTHERGAHDFETVAAVFDAATHCHVGHVVEGRPVVIPTLHWREGRHVYWHGSSASRMLRKSKGAQVCLTATLLDGYVLARSGMHHSANFRSVMVFGEAEIVPDELKEARLRAFVDGLFPGRWEMLRPMTAQEAKATTILSMPLDEASAKIRTGGPVDDEEDYALPIWAGVIPLGAAVGAVEPDPLNLEGVEQPAHVTAFGR